MIITKIRMNSDFIIKKKKKKRIKDLFGVNNYYSNLIFVIVLAVQRK